MTTQQDGHDVPSPLRADAGRKIMVPSQRWIMLGLGVWLIAIVATTAWVWRYKRTAGPVGAVPGQWPAVTALSHDRFRPQLTLFLHPRCACSRASLAELSQLVSMTQGRTAIAIVFGLPSGAPGSWSQGELWDTARAIRGARVIPDQDCRESVRFGALTSGHVTLYDTSGVLMFAGGMTPARGHQGNNPGFDRLCAVILGHEPRRRSSPVFGCALAAAPTERRMRDVD